ncbi:MAG: Eco57I restriction-modification methylase domain-containing protein [Muribaculaceae bacterium]|nr:Eco57I restriction-modification methylase domain-containing protein [Muribaculaceae bacterium]
MNRNTFNEYILDANFRGLFLSELGWNKPKGNSHLLPIVIDDNEYTFTCVAEKNGLQVLVTEVDTMPTNSLARRIDTQLRKQAQDYIAIYKASKRQGHHAWIVPVKNVDKRDLVSIEYITTDQADFLRQKLDFITFRHDETITIVDVKEGVNRAFAVNSEKITKDFYSGFKKEHTAFTKFITGIDDNIAVKENRNKQWYASVMLNRLMFCYFIQKKGFLDGNVNYLRDKLDWVRQEQGKDHFFGSFYKKFLTQLFSDGLNAPKHGREFVNKFGRIPYLNGGMFDTHQIERDYADIDIADDAFISLFTFFDKWQWHLDTRVTASGRDINPDVLGYIFEQYINDRAAMGAYYTKEDITEYIGRNCILPFLFDEVKRTNKDDGGYFTPNGYVWQTLRNSGNRYIFDAVKKGYEDFDEIPENIRRGIITESMHHEYSETPIKDLPEDHVPLAELRSDWNSRTPEQWGLPNEIWRETIERMQRCGDILHKIESGEITTINDFITYNLDIRSFAHDLLADGDSRFVGRFYHALQEVTILDPTCGSGAFLFAAMNILEPLYEICIERMQEFNVQNPKLFKKELEEINHRYRSNIQYFIFKSIILRNLYGVDIMAEATEIAKLRMFLKMVAVVDVDYRAENLGLDPLPDIDFNIRCGNTLVGYANKEQLFRDLNDSQGSFDVMLANEEFKEQITEEMDKVARAYGIFKDIQLSQDENMHAFKQAKSELRERLVALNDKLNRRLFLASTGFGNNQAADFTDTQVYRDWLASHQPFHWLAEFYQIIEGNHGFDVIIGNPPYVVYSKKDIKTGKSIQDLYKFDWCSTIQSNNLYVFTLERSLSLSSSKNIGFIIPLSFGAGKKNTKIRNLYNENKNLYVSSYEIRPAKLFDGGGGADQRLNIIITAPSKNSILYSTGVRRWKSEHRSYLFKNFKYSCTVEDNQLWRFSSGIEFQIKKKFDYNKALNSQIIWGNSSDLYYRSAGLRYWIIFSATGFDTNSSSNKTLSLINDRVKDIVFCALSSNLYWWYYACNYDMFNQTISNIEEFRITINDQLNFSKLAKSLDASQKENRIESVITKKDGEMNVSYAYNKKLSKHIIDEIDMVFARHYGFTDEELDFIINYDIKYRMGDELNNSEE